MDGVHEQGTEIKAITYSAMQIVERNARPGASEPADDGKEAGPKTEARAAKRQGSTRSSSSSSTSSISSRRT